MYYPFDEGGSTDFSNNRDGEGYNGFKKHPFKGLMGLPSAPGISYSGNLSFNETKRFSIAMWFRLKDNITTQVIFARNNSYIIYESSGADATFTGDVGGLPCTATSTYWDMNWHHIVLSSDYSKFEIEPGMFIHEYNYTIYIDSNLHCIGQSPADIPIQDTTMFFGSNISLGEKTDNIDEVMIFSSPLTPEEVTDIYRNQSIRYDNNGVHILQNNSLLNHSTGVTQVVVNSSFLSNLPYGINTTINLLVSYYVNDWVNTTPQELSNDGNTFNISGLANQTRLEY